MLCFTWNPAKFLFSVLYEVFFFAQDSSCSIMYCVGKSSCYVKKSILTELLAVCNMSKTCSKCSLIMLILHVFYNVLYFRSIV